MSDDKVLVSRELLKDFMAHSAPNERASVQHNNRYYALACEVSKIIDAQPSDGALTNEGAEPVAWISCDDEMPPEGREVLVWYAQQWPNDKKFYCSAGSLHKLFEGMDRLFWHNGRGEVMTGTVTHWCGFPLPPASTESRS